MGILHREPELMLLRVPLQSKWRDDINIGHSMFCQAGYLLTIRVSSALRSDPNARFQQRIFRFNKFYVTWRHWIVDHSARARITC